MSLLLNTIISKFHTNLNATHEMLLYLVKAKLLCKHCRSLNSDAGPSTETNYQLKGHTSNAKTRGEETNRIFFTNATKDGIGAQNQNILNSFSQDRNIDKFIDDETETRRKFLP